MEMTLREMRRAGDGEKSYCVKRSLSSGFYCDVFFDRNTLLLPLCFFCLFLCGMNKRVNLEYWDVAFLS